MADGTQLNVPASLGDVISTDDVDDGGVADGQKVQRVKPGFGIDGSYLDPSMICPFPVTPSPLVMAELALGNIAGYEQVLKYGQNTEIDSGQTEDVWDGGGFYPWPTAAALQELVSTSLFDTSAGTGARTVQVSGLDANYAPVSEIMTLNGVTPVPTTESYLRVFRIRVLTAGSGGENAGNVQIRGVGAGTVIAQVSIGNNSTQMAIYTVQAGSTFFINAIFGSIYNALGKGYGELEMRVRVLGGVFTEYLNAGMATDGTTSFAHSFTIPLAIPEKADILIRATVTANDTKAIATFGGFMKDN